MLREKKVSDWFIGFQGSPLPLTIMSTVAPMHCFCPMDGAGGNVRLMFGKSCQCLKSLFLGISSLDINRNLLALKLFLRVDRDERAIIFQDSILDDSQ